MGSVWFISKDPATKGRHGFFRVAGWPGGSGRGVLAGLRREVAEETGLSIIGDPQLAFLVEFSTLEGTYTAMTFACEVDGDLNPADPDGIVTAAAWVPFDETMGRLALVDWYDVLPLRRYLAGEATAGARYRFTQQ
jgi:ADP-ribose pyrophosphatase YjhB (NUDIX family)